MVYQVGGQNQLKGFLANNWLDLDNTPVFPYQFTTLVSITHYISYNRIIQLHNVGWYTVTYRDSIFNSYPYVQLFTTPSFYLASSLQSLAMQVLPYFIITSTYNCTGVAIWWFNHSS